MAAISVDFSEEQWKSFEAPTADDDDLNKTLKCELLACHKTSTTLGISV